MWAVALDAMSALGQLLIVLSPLAVLAAIAALLVAVYLLVRFLITHRKR